MRRLLTLIAATAFSFAATADDYTHLSVHTNAKTDYVELATIQKITFEGELIVVTTSEGKTTFPISQVNKLSFTNAPTNIGSLPTKSKNMHISNGMLKVDGNDMLYIYNADGKLVHMTMIDGQTTISLSSLPKGTYIISMGNNTIKTTR